MTDHREAKGFLPSFNALDNPSILSKLINNDAMERLTGFAMENSNNFDEDDPKFFLYLLDESLKDAWDRLLTLQKNTLP